MSRIPYRPAAPCSIASTPATRVHDRAGRRPPRDRQRRARARRRSTTWRSWAGSCSTWTTALGIPRREQAVLFERLLTLLTSCDERRYGQWEQQSWWDFVGAERRSDGVPEVPRRRADAHARRGAGAGDERAYRRADPRASCCSTSPEPEGASTRAGRADERRVDRPVGAAPARPRRRAASRLPGRRVSSSTATASPASRRRRRPARSTADYYVAALPVEIMRLLAGTAVAPAGAAARRARPSRHPLDERRAVLPRHATCRSSTATRSTSTRSGR